MKVLFFILFVSLLSVDAQRRSARTELTENDPTPKSARRGRARFVAPPAEQQLDEQKHQEPSVRRAVLRRRPDVQIEANPRRNYEVEEIIDDTPVETFRKSAKPRVFTETKFEAQNASPVSPLFHPATTENLEEVIKSIGSLVGDTTTSSVSVSPPSSVSYEPSSSELSSSEFSKIENEITRTQPEVTTPSTTRTTRRTNGRSRNNGVVNSPSNPTVASRVRTRVRARKPEEPVSTAAPARTVHRGSRRRSETTESRTKGPSVIVAAETVEIPTRARAGRRTVGISSRKVEEVKSPEKIALDLSQPRRSSNRKPVESSTARSRTRTRFRDVPPVIDEQKLEVLPLFERETKTVKPIRKVVARRRTFNSAEEVETSATENDVKLADKPSTERRPKQNVVETKTESRPKQTVNVHSRTDSQPKQSVVVETRTESSSLKRRRQTSKPVIKESVVSEITEVTSKRTIIRRASPKPKTVESKPVARNESRGAKKSEINLGQVAGKNKSGLTSSEEEIDDTDNYPEHFKALLQAKKQKKESRSQHRLVTPPTVTKTTEKVVTSSSSTTTQIISAEANRQREDSENELDPSTPSSSRPTRRRLPQSTTEKVARTTRKNKVVRSTTAAPLPARDHRFHAKFNTEPEATSNSVKSNRNLSTKPPRGLYSSRKVKESHSKSKSSTGQIPTPKKSNRYSSRYRNDASSRNAIRTSTSAPYYLPTIPTITPPTTSVKSPIVSEDKDLGVEVISFDDPVNTVPSANLVSGEYLASSTESHLTSPLVSAAQTKTTEKPVSIIERIINSITAISTTEVPDPTKLTTPEQETETKESAILKLATKKPTKLDKTQSTQKLPNVTVTSEKPTTIIERIISSLSAIQADNTTDNKSFKSKQVGTNFNTISSPSTTPITRVTKSTLPAQFSTSVNPLTVLDDISSDQILLQKRTIGKLLALLNSLTSTTPCPHPPLVVVTPKAASFVTGTRTASTTTTIEPVVATSIATTIAPPSTVTPTTNTANQGTTTPVTTTPTQQLQLFTSANPNVSLDSRINTPETTTIRYTNTPTVTTITTPVPETTTSATTTSTLSPTLTEAVPTSTTSSSVVNEALPLSIDAGVTSSVTESSTSSTTDSSSSVSSSTLATTQSAVDTETAFVFPPTIPAVINFEVSPGSVSIFSANDLSNLITPDDTPSTTVTISGRFNAADNVATTESTTPTQNTTPIQTTTPVQATTSIETTTPIPTTTPVQTSTGMQSVTPIQTTTPVQSTPPTTIPVPTSTPVQTTTLDAVGNTTPMESIAQTTPIPTTTPLPTTTFIPNSADNSTISQTTSVNIESRFAGTTESSTDAVTTMVPSTTTENVATNNTTTQDISSNVIDTTGPPEKSNQTSTVIPSTNSTAQVSNRSGQSSRSGRLLNIVQDPVQNSVETTTIRNKDYFIFAVLNNNTILRKRPSRFPTKDTPFLIVGVYPNNTLVRKFPNGTLVPMEPIIRVSGFDTRENPPPLPEITSNQVTPDQGRRPDNKNLQTVDQNTIPSLEANPLSIISANNATTTTANTTTEPSIRPNPLSISSISSSTTESSTSSTTTSNDSNSTTQSATTTTPGTTTSSTAPTATLPSLTEILNGRTVQAFNSIINISELNKVETLDVDRKTHRVLNSDRYKNKTDVIFRWKPVTSPTYTFNDMKNNPVTTMLPTTSTLSNRILEDVTTSTVRIPSTIQQSTMFTTTALPITTTQATTTTLVPTTTTTIPPTTTTKAPTTITTRAPTTTITRAPKTTTTRAPTTTTLIPSTTTTNIPTTISSTTRFTATPTVVPLSQFDFTSRTTTGFPSTTFIPSFLTTLFSTTRPRRVSTTGAPITIVTPETTTTRVTTPRVEIRTVSGDLSTSASTTTRYISNVVSTATAPTTLSTTTVRNTRRRSTTIPTTTIPPAVPVSSSVRSTRRSTTTASTDSSTKKLRQLTEQQKKDLETLAQLEMEQAAILKQLAFLTNLNFANLRTTTDKNDLANRIIALAVEQDKERQKTTTPSSETLSPEGSRQAKQITPKNDQSLDELLKQLNIATPSTITSQYGKSQDAIIAALLKEQGIGPTTPKALEDIYSQTTTASTTTTTTRKPRPTTRPPGPLMQSLNWLLNVLAPPTTTTTRRPRPKSKSKSKPKPKSTTTPTPEREDPIPTPEKKDKPNPEELLTHQPTHITPVVTPAPRKNIVSSLSQSDIQKLIKQLENLQKDPNSEDLDFSSIKSLQSLINEEGVQVSSSGTTGTTSRATTPMPRKSKSKNRVVKSTTAVPLSVSNNIADEEDATTTTRPRVSLPPVRLRPVPGIEDSETLVRGQLITAAVNVTRAISTFLGTALQGAANGFQTLLGTGSRAVGSLMQISSNTSSRPG